MSDGGGNRWLRHHFHEFVFPAFMAAEKKSSEIGKPFHVKASPKAPEHLPTELKKLWTLCMDMKVQWDFDVREINSHSGHSKYRESARIHYRILNDTLSSALAALRDEGCSRLFYGGRDVWSYAVISAKKKIPFLFVPELSRTVAGRASCRPFLEAAGFTGDELFLDTGFAGSIPRSMQAHWPGRKFHFRLMSQNDIVVETSPKSELVDCDPEKEGKIRKWLMKNTKYRRRPQQLFPNRNRAREEALETEYLAKYWKTGTYESVLEQGFAPEVFKEWKDKPAVRKFLRKTHGKTNYGLFDGERVVFVGESDLYLAKGLAEWLLTLPTVADAEVPVQSEQIVQYFSDRRTIQRAALLTSMLWRGIPFWKAAMSAKAKAQAGVYMAGGAVFNNTNTFTVNPNVATTGVTHFTAGTTAATNFTVTQNHWGMLESNITGNVWPSTNAVTQHPSPQQMQQMEQMILAKLALNAQKAMAEKGQTVPGTLALNPAPAPSPNQIQDALDAVPKIPEFELVQLGPPAFLNKKTELHKPEVIDEIPSLDSIDMGWDLAPA